MTTKYIDKGNSGPREMAGFTLIELLVVIAIIAILAAILLPVLAAARLRAWQIYSVNNVKELTVASRMYYDDYKIFIGPINTNNPALSDGDWMGTMIGYYGHATNMLFCPAAPDRGINPAQPINAPGNADTAWHWNLQAGYTYTASYGYNKSLESNIYGFSTNNFNVEGNVKNPSFTPVFTDSAWINYYPTAGETPPTSLYDPIDHPGTNPSGLSRMCMARHGGRAPGAAPQSLPFGTTYLPGSVSVGLWDGSAQAVKLQNLWQYYWTPGWSPRSPPAVL